MDSQPSNLAGTLSLVFSVALILLWIGGMCIGWIPFVGMFMLLFVPVEWFLAFAGLVTGIVGFRASQVHGVGAVPSLVGAMVSGGWIAFQAVVIGSVVFLFGGLTVLSVLGALLEGGH
ncbi:MAG: hypothetical protein ABMA64_14940 [Myxococcota bacterium]